MTDVFTPLSLTVSQVFINGDPLYKIPNYQRPYSWTDEQVDRLWDDLFTAFENNKEDKKNPKIEYKKLRLIIDKNGIKRIEQPRELSRSRK